MILVWSTVLKPAPSASVRAAWRTRTTSSEERISTFSLFCVVIFRLRRREPRVDESHAALDVQGGFDAGERQSKLDQRDRHRGPHADNHGVGVQNARDRGDVVEHPADETVDDLQRRDIDENALRVGVDNLAGQILFQCGRQTIVHVDLNGHQQRIPEFEDWNAIHCYRSFPASVLFWSEVAVVFFLVTIRPVRSSAIASASAKVAFEMTFSSTPKCTMVCAICGRMPLMMQSAPMRRAAATGLSRCCAVSVSTVGTPVISMIAIDASVSTIAWRRVSITTCVRWLSNVPIIGNARMPSHSLTTGVDNSAISRCWRTMTSSRLFWNTSSVNRPSSSSRVVIDQVSSATWAGEKELLRVSVLKSGCFNEKTKVAVSLGENPWVARARETSVSNCLAGP